MSRIEKAFKSRKAKGEKTFIPFVTAGDPALAATRDFVKILEEEGADIIELGIPFTDPVADGPVIERANLRAMKHQITVDKVFDLVKEIREESEVALVFLIYANMIYHYGIRAFFKACQVAGLDGVIVPDVPLEEKEEFDYYARRYGVDFISLVAPTSKARIEEIAKDARGFLYCVSSMGVTGVRETIDTNLEEMFEAIKRYAKIPTALGFGIATPMQMTKVKDYADGIIVGSAIVEIIETHGLAAAEPLRTYARDMIKALRT